jgi:hypothetical protein
MQLYVIEIDTVDEGTGGLTGRSRHLIFSDLQQVLRLAGSYADDTRTFRFAFWRVKAFEPVRLENGVVIPTSPAKVVFEMSGGEERGAAPAADIYAAAS